MNNFPRHCWPSIINRVGHFDQSIGDRFNQSIGGTGFHRYQLSPPWCLFLVVSTSEITLIYYEEKKRLGSILSNGLNLV